MSMTRDAAAEIGARALLFLAQRPEDVAAFLAETGAEPSSLRAAAEDPSALGFVLAHLSRREELAEAFCRAEALAPEALAAAESALLGGETHWI